MHLTVAICTWNRSALLDQTLTAMRGLEIPSDISWELLIVNNNCTDNTDHVIAKHEAKLPIRRLFDRRRGKAFAMNHAVPQARGEYILWTDDDVLVDSGWMVAYTEAFRAWPAASIFGGPVRPWFEGTSPEWLNEVFPRISSAYAVRDLGDEPIDFSQAIVPYGANMVVRRKEQSEHLYNTALGPCGNSFVGGDDTDLLRRMLAKGMQGRWVPKASVRHYIPRQRQTVKYLRHYYKGLGKQLARRELQGTFPTLFGRPRWLWKQVIEGEIKYRFRRAVCEPKVWIEDLIKASIAWGQLTDRQRPVR